MCTEPNGNPVAVRTILRHPYTACSRRVVTVGAGSGVPRGSGRGVQGYCIDGCTSRTGTALGRVLGLGAVYWSGLSVIVRNCRKLSGKVVKLPKSVQKCLEKWSQTRSRLTLRLITETADALNASLRPVWISLFYVILV